MSDEVLMNITMAAEFVGCQRGTLHKAVIRGKVPSYKFNNTKTKRVKLSEVVEWNKTRPRFKYQTDTVEIKLIVPNKLKCLNCGGDRWIYKRKTNTYHECPSCNKNITGPTPIIFL